MTDIKSTAERIVELLKDCVTIVLAEGYSINPDGSRNLFQRAKISRVKKNSAHKVLRLTASYADGSEIRYSWSQHNGSRYTARS